MVSVPQLGKVTLAEYWCSIITRAVMNDRLSQIPMQDMVELIEHCELHIPHGTLYAHNLMETLRAALRTQREYLGMPALTHTKMFSILPMTAEEETVAKREQALLEAMSAAAPDHLPTKEEFSTAFLYMRAMARWRAAQTLKAHAVAQAELDGATGAEEL